MFDRVLIWIWSLRLFACGWRFCCFEYESRTCHSSGCWYDKDHDVEEFDYHHRREEEESAEKKNKDAAASQIWRGAWVKELPLVHPKARLTHSSRPAVALWSYSSTSPRAVWTRDIFREPKIFVYSLLKINGLQQFESSCSSIICPSSKPTILGHGLAAVYSGQKFMGQFTVQREACLAWTLYLPSWWVEFRDLVNAAFCEVVTLTSALYAWSTLSKVAGWHQCWTRSFTESLQ